jgi:hypothetical protein
MNGEETTATTQYIGFEVCTPIKEFCLLGYSAM